MYGRQWTSKSLNKMVNLLLLLLLLLMQQQQLLLENALSFTLLLFNPLTFVRLLLCCSFYPRQCHGC